MTLLDLFSGIGGFSLGLERAGFRTVAFCEIDPWCRRVLAKHWPNVPAYDDVRQLDAARLRADGIERVDAICGGFPCQDISTAGKGAGLDGERSGLWREYARLVGDLRPRFAIVENVGALRGRGLATVLGDLAALRYDAEWHAIPAAAVGAHHLRDRVWIIATAANASEFRRRSQRRRNHAARRAQPANLVATNAAGRGLPQLRGLFGPLARALAATSAPWERSTEPAFLRNVHGISSRVDRLRVKALGNAVVPLIPELIGRALLEAA
jgi:DNA (cytosine-5)-methyltransferase 1